MRWWEESRSEPRGSLPMCVFPRNLALNQCPLDLSYANMALKIRVRQLRI